MKAYLALDIGGTKIDVCSYDEEYQLTNVDTLKTADFRARSIEFADDVKEIIRSHITPNTSRVGISWNCFLNKGIILWSSLLGGSVNYPLEAELKKEFNIFIRTDDDIHSMAVAEHKFGKGKGTSHFLLLNIATGVGAGYYENGLLRGANNLAGGYSFVPIYVEEYGRFFATENLISGRGIQEFYKYFSGVEMSAKDICNLPNNNEILEKTMMLFSKYLTRHLVDLTFYYNPRKVIINGSIKKAAHLYLPQTIEQYRDEMVEIGRGMRDPRTVNLPFDESNMWQGAIEEITTSDLEHAACLGVIC